MVFRFFLVEEESFYKWNTFYSTPYSLGLYIKNLYLHVKKMGRQELGTLRKWLQTDKLNPKSDECNFVGYPKEMRRYYFNLPTKQKVFVSNKAYFLKKEFLSEGISVLKIELDKVRQVEELTSMFESKSDLIRSNSEPNTQTSLRRSDRVPSQ